MSLLALKDLHEQFAGDVIGDALAMGNGGVEIWQRSHFQREVAGEDFGQALSDPELADILEIGQSAKEENTLDEPVGVLHLIDRFLMFLVRKLGYAPVRQHPGVQEILADGGQFVLESRVQEGDDLDVASKGRRRRGPMPPGPAAFPWVFPGAFRRLFLGIVRVPFDAATRINRVGRTAAAAMAVRIRVSFNLLQTQTIIHGHLKPPQIDSHNANEYQLR